jgi:Protein of unknown function (DUF4245)
MTTPAASRRLRQSVTDMGRSLGLMALVIAALLALGPGRTLLFPSGDVRPAADYSSQVSGFGQLAGTPALTPAGLPGSWRANASTLRHTTSTVRLHIGWAVPGERFAGLDEATGDPDSLVRSVLGARGLTVAGTATIGGVSWQRRVSDRGEQSLVRQAGRVTVVLTGSATDAELRLLAGSLR